MPIRVTTHLPAIEDLTLHPGSDTIELTWTGVDNGTLVIETRPADGSGEWTTRATADVQRGATEIDAAPVATGELVTLRATVETEHSTSPSVEDLLTLTLPIAALDGSATPAATVDARSPHSQPVAGTATPTTAITTTASHD